MERRTVEGHEGHHVDNAQAGVGTGVAPQVQAGDGLGGQGPGVAFDGVAGQGQYRAVVVGVGVHVEQRAPGGGGQRLERGGVPPLAQVDHTLEHRAVPSHTPYLQPVLPSNAVDIGLALPQYDFGSAEPGVIGWDPVERTARLAEDLGFASLWLSDHLFLDRGRYGGPPGRCPGLDPLPALAAVARVTSTVRLGPLTLCGPLRPATVTAKQLASLDNVSGGRLVVGIGAGWYEDEFAAAGIPFRRPGERLAQLEEAVRVLRGMFEGGPFTFDGRYERASAARCLPTPVQRPGPPIWVGGKGDRLLDLVAASPTAGTRSGSGRPTRIADA